MLTSWPSMGSGLSGFAVVGLPVLIPALVGRDTLNHNADDSCFQTSMVGAALMALTATVPVTGSHATAARSPMTSSRTCFTPPIHAETMAVVPVPAIEACIQPLVGQKAPGSSTSGRGGAEAGASVIVHPFRATAPAVTPLLNSLVKAFERSSPVARLRSRPNGAGGGAGAADGMPSLSTRRLTVRLLPAASSAVTSNRTAPPAGTGSPIGTVALHIPACA